LSNTPNAIDAWMVKHRLLVGDSPEARFNGPRIAVYVFVAMAVLIALGLAYRQAFHGDIRIDNLDPDLIEDVKCNDDGRGGVRYSGRYMSSIGTAVGITVFDADANQIGVADEFVGGGGAGTRFSGTVFDINGTPDSCTFQVFID
jgi:hypothetical protein